ncbi:MAG: DUF5103 domain-containing protein [Paludibacteraceae bacterium]|nr:DUF5103 domain-containing protein [Paludibacteraceae bacterium]
MKRLLWTIGMLLALQCVRGAAPYRTQALSGHIRSVQIYNYQRTPYLPVIELGSSDRITLTFDDLATTPSTYSYRFVHCRSDWTPDDLMESDYIDGFPQGYIDQYAFSMNTYFSYTHYEKTFPDEGTGFRLSGNYVLLAFAEEQPETPVLSACFSVVEQRIVIRSKVSALTDAGYQRGFQQVSLELDHAGYDIQRPDTELDVQVFQNGRCDNAARRVQPDYTAGQTLLYKHDRQLVFEAGNTFRVFDISSPYVLGDRVESIDYHAPYYHVTLYPDEIRDGKTYSHQRDVAGRYQVHRQYSEDPGTESDYYFTHFTLPMELPMTDGDVYLMGELTGYRLDEQARMEYNPMTMAYEKTLLLKQGGYNYLYVFVPKGAVMGSPRPIEGNRWETGNEYTLYVYHRPFGSKYDRLIGFDVVYADQRYEKPGF